MCMYTYINTDIDFMYSKSPQGYEPTGLRGRSAVTYANQTLDMQVTFQKHAEFMQICCQLEREQNAGYQKAMVLLQRPLIRLIV